MTYDPRKLGASCGRCPRRSQRPVPPEGKSGAAIVWLGQDPGDRETAEGRPFVGPTGTRLTHIWERACEKMLGRVIPRAEIWITNSAKCQPITKSAREAKQAVDCCRPLLYNELRQAIHSRAAFLFMGKWAWYAVTGMLKGVDSYKGFHVTVELKRLKELINKTKLPEVSAEEEDDISF